MQHRRSLFCHTAVGFIVIALSAAAKADLPAMRLDRIVPLGATAGTTVDVQISAAEADDAKQLTFDHPGIKSEWLEKGKFKVTIAADVPAGTYDVRLLGPYGVSNPRLFAVSHGLTDVVEKEPNDVPAAAQVLAINSAVAGASDGNGRDLYRFAARQGQRLTIDCQSTKLDVAGDACLSVVAADGAVLAGSGDYHGRDPLIDFVAPADGEFLIEMHDLSYRGGFPYRLIVTDRPDVENVFPRAVEPGKPVELIALGRNFGTAGKPSTWKIDECSLDEFRFSITPPGPTEALGSYRFIDHPSDHSVLPTAATCTLAGFQLRVPIGGGANPPVTLMYADGPVTLEREPNDAREQPQPVTLQLTLSGRFDVPRDGDWFEFTPAEQGRYGIQVYSERIAGQADPYVVVVDEKGNRLTEIDDFGHRVNAFDGHLRDPVGAVDLQAGAKYRLLVQDRYGRGGARYQYVLTVHRARPDFYVAAIAATNPAPSGMNIWRGGATWFDLIVHREDGFDQPITIAATGLPPGMHAAEVKIPNDIRGSLVLWADADAPAWNGSIRLTATGQHGDATLRHEVRPYTRVWNDGGVPTSRPMRELAVAIVEKAPYSLQAMPDNPTVEMNGKLQFKIKAERLWPECQAAIKVIGLGLPGGFQFSEREIASGQNEGVFELQVGNMRPGEYTLTLLGQCQVPIKKNADAQAVNTLVAIPCRQITVKVVEKPK
ncbi:MAG TPA: PPC domain-containing protein [Pirellulales bacterium]